MKFRILLAAALCCAAPSRAEAQQLVSPVRTVTCTNQFLRALSGTGAWTCASVANADLVNSTISGISLGSNLNNLTHGSTLTGTLYNGSAAVSNWDIDLTHANAWSGQQTFAAVKGTASTQAGTSYPIQTSDCGKTIVFTSSSAITVTTLAAIVSGTEVCAIAIRQKGTGQVTISDGAGATHGSANGWTKTRTQYSLIGLTVEPDSPSLYIIDGDGA